jgi:hypothetical protein
MGMCRQRFSTQSWRNDWSVSMKNACASASTGRRADRMESCLMEPPCTIIRIIFSIIRIICLGWTGMWALQVSPTHCASRHTHSECNTEFMEDQGSCRCCPKCRNCYDYTQLFYIISRLLRLVFRLYADIRRTFRSVLTMDVGKPTGTHSRTKFIAQVIKVLGYGLPLVCPHVVRQSKFLTNLQ